jgi:proteasome alpha subunit
MYTPFDFNEAVGHRKDYVEDRLREGSPVVGLAYDGGLLLLTVRRTQRKVYEIYDRHMFSAIGNQSDVESVRLASINLTHQEGFERSPDDVSMQRLVGFSLSPALKKGFGDQLVVPFVLKALFAELGRTPAADVFYVLNYDGEFRRSTDAAVIAGTQAAEDKMLQRIGEPSRSMNREAALSLAISAWCVGAREALKRSAITDKKDADNDDYNPLRDIDEADADQVFLRDELKTGTIEVGVLERRAGREGRFHLLSDADIAAAIPDLK